MTLMECLWAPQSNSAHPLPPPATKTKLIYHNCPLFGFRGSLYRDPLDRDPLPDVGLENVSVSSKTVTICV